MMPRIRSVATRFHLYKNVRDLNAAQLQNDLTRETAKTNHGLRFAKFFGRWQDSDTPELVKQLQTDETDRRGTLVGPKPTQPILDWLDPRKTGDAYRIPGHEFKTLKVGNVGQLISARNRLGRLAHPTRGATHFDLDLISRLLIGTGLPHPTKNGMLFHPTLGVPYIPGSALKQVAQDWAEEEEGLEDDDLTRLRLFGGPKHGMGCIAFLDALPCVPVTLTAEQITNHYSGYYQNIKPAKRDEIREDMHQPADWYDPIPVTMLAVEAGFTKCLPFRFAILPLRGAKDGDVETVQKWLTQGLEIYGVGARTTLGFGRFESDEAREKREKMLRDDKEHEEELARKTAAAIQAAQDEAQANWVPAIGDIVVYEHAEPGEQYKISELQENGDFIITRIGDTNPVLSDTGECTLAPNNSIP